MHLPILYQDDYLVAINKPHGLLVHRSPIAGNVSEFALQYLKHQLGRYVYPVHRLDRKTGGVLLFTLDRATLSTLQQAFEKRAVEKTYLAIVRGFTEDSGEIDHPLKKENGNLQDSLTAYKTLQRAEIDIPFGKHATSRYSLLEIYPHTGRKHQIRRHLAHIFHPIIGDRPHGCNKQNKLWKEKWNMTKMLLHASFLAFEHPISGERLEIRAGVQEVFAEVQDWLFGIPKDKSL